MAHIEKVPTKRGHSYKAYVHVQGKLKTKTFPKLYLAKDWAAKQESRKDDVKFEIQSHKVTVGELIRLFRKDRYPELKNTQNHEYSLKYFESEIGDMVCSKVTGRHIATAMKAKSKSDTTFNRWIAYLSAVFELGIEYKMITNNPVKDIRKKKESRGRLRFLTEEEIPRLLRACKNSQADYLYPIVLLAISTGARKGEILNLDWDQVDFKNRRIVLEDTKNGERRTLPMTKKLVQPLAEWRLKNQGKMLFPYQDIKRSWHSALRAAEIENFTFHDLRHTCASYLAMEGISLLEIADILGHKTLKMVQRYAHLSDQRKRDTLDALSGKILNF